MSSHRIGIPPAAAALYREGPFVGALLRMTNLVSRERSLRTLAERGFTDLNQALLSGFSGRRQTVCGRSISPNRPT